MDPGSHAEVAELFDEFDRSELPQLMGTRRRELFHYRGLYFHLQDFDGEHGSDAIQQTREHPRFVRISDDLKPFIEAYDPVTWRSPKDAMATRFYHWEDK
ncbi:polyketide synthase [Actinokineospora bangkokensis]|uniref:Polyketide synthase n=2 Tax=Actinokineospora bangkokensis TaxID=1193682 RepID=A0A1Q9LMZ0_9PSEU|nr:polyketide synthase [Actinokineospora bangkokensis]